jgi:hypothetical protein
MNCKTHSIPTCIAITMCETITSALLNVCGIVGSLSIGPLRALFKR